MGTLGRVYGGMRGEQVLLSHSAYYLLTIYSISVGYKLLLSGRGCEISLSVRRA